MKQKGLGRGLDAIFGSEHLDARLKPMTEMAEISVSEALLPAVEREPRLHLLGPEEQPLA